MKEVSRWLASLVILALALVLLAPTVYAAPPLPHGFYGTVKINGHSAPAGAVVKAKFGATVCGTYTTTEDGQYGDTATSDYLSVTDESLHDGDTLNFYVNDVDTGQTAQFTTGGGPTELNLTADISNYLYSYIDAAFTTSTTTFSSSTHRTVYILATGFTASQAYRMAYYDGGDTKRLTRDRTSSVSGNFSSHRTFVADTDVSGTWHVIVCSTSYTPPSSYSASWENTIASHTFTVQSSAIPEFPTILAGIIALSLSMGIYLWMRRKAIRVSN